MASPNLRDLVGDIREALDRFPPESLREILTYVFKEYVVEGAAPIATSVPTLRDDLDGMSFAEVIRSLQLRLDLPELGLFEVQNDRVLVKIGGRQMPLELQGARSEAPPPPLPMAVPAPPPPGVNPSPALARPSAPGTSRQELPAGRPAVAAVPVAPATPAASVGARPAAPAKAATPGKSVDDKPEQADRFRKVEID
ncbi:MAG: hypothetical protein EXR72_08240 [Myxococcales bacterium]|nr:hypothetical protein [Myxococcales bacterium]